MITSASDGRAFSLVLHRKTLVKLFCLAMFADQTWIFPVSVNLILLMGC